jgi:hypothetical protein
MRRWRVVALILSLLAFTLAAAGSVELGPGAAFFRTVALKVGGTTFFWLGVACFLVAAWRGGGT